MVNLAPQQVGSIETTENRKIWYSIGQSSRLTYEQIVEMMNTILETVLTLVKQDLVKWIYQYVAKATGQLQDSLLLALDTSSVDTTSQFLKLVLGSDIPYNKYVAQMPSEMVQHSGERRWVNYYMHYGYIMLNDPEAQGHYWGLLKMEARRSLRDNLKLARNTIAGSVGVSARPLVNAMKVK
jgi:hypothetical protein